MLKRAFDILFVLPGLIILFPLMGLIALFIRMDSKGPVLYIQNRVGRYGKPFGLYKFRTMHPDSDKKGLLTVGGRDPRVTSIGYTLRRYKLDELPQLVNVLKGEMSLVGPRPEVQKYVDLYTPEQRQVLTLRPGLTDYASLHYFNENELLADSADPEKRYVEELMPAKLKLNLQYLRDAGLFTDLKIIFKTLLRIVS